MSALSKLRQSLDRLVDDLVALTNGLSIRRLDRFGGGFAIMAPEFYWGDASQEQKQQQLELVRRYKQIFELLSAWLHDAPANLVREFEEADEHFKVWLELQSNWGLTANKIDNAQALIESAVGLRNVIGILGATPVVEVVVIPDTNSLLQEPDPARYRITCNAEAFEFLLLPTVLKELDKLKVLHRVPEIRDKAKRAITRIKGWRAQGSLLEGVTVDKSIHIHAVHNEPDVSKSLSWLDPESEDDRIIASILRVQAARPTARVLLVTGDINLQNKADAAMIETAELESTD